MRSPLGPRLAGVGLGELGLNRVNMEWTLLPLFLCVLLIMDMNKDAAFCVYGLKAVKNQE